MTKYLNVYYTGEVFEYSKTKQPDFEEHKNAEGNVSGYRKYYTKGVTGELANVGVRTTEYGTNINVVLKDSEGDYNSVQFRLKDQRGNIDDFAESLIRFLPNMEKGVTYRLYPYTLKAEDQKKFDEDNGNDVKEKYYDSKGVSVKVIDTETGELVKLEAALNYVGDDETTTIPRVEWKVDRATKKKKPTATTLEAKNDFLTEKLMDAAEGHLAYEANETPTKSQQTKEEPKPSEAIATADDDEDLPF